MKNSLFPAVIFAAALPVTALASVASDEASKAIHEPLAAESSAPMRTTVNTINLAALDTLGQSYGVAQTFHNIALETHHVTAFPEKSDNSSAPAKPLDW